MAQTFKTLRDSDRVTTRTLLHEMVPVTGTISSGTYTDLNIKNYSHGMFQSVYDYPYLSGSANHIFDLSVGYASQSPLSSSASSQNAKKINIYNQMSQVLVGYDHTGNVRQFDRDGDLSGTTGKINEAVFVCFSRLLTKDEIKKGSFSMTIATGGVYSAPDGNITITDSGSATDYRVNSPAGEYGVLYDTRGKRLGLLYYQAGICVLTASVFGDLSNADGVTTVAGDTDNPLVPITASNYFFIGDTEATPASSIVHALTGSEISSSCDGFRNRLVSVEFQNTTELNSSIYFCRANHNEFNYSSNPTYLTGSKIRVKGDLADLPPVSYITTVGLYSPDRVLMAVAKLSEPIRKDPTRDFTLRVRLDF
jgi:hypothetical protein